MVLEGITGDVRYKMYKEACNGTSFSLWIFVCTLFSLLHFRPCPRYILIFSTKHKLNMITLVDDELWSHHMSILPSLYKYNKQGNNIQKHVILVIRSILQYDFKA